MRRVGGKAKKGLGISFLRIVLLNKMSLEFLPRWHGGCDYLVSKQKSRE